jgi:hypothetical protein
LFVDTKGFVAATHDASTNGSAIDAHDCDDFDGTPFDLGFQRTLAGGGTIAPSGTFFVSPSHACSHRCRHGRETRTRTSATTATVLLDADTGGDAVDVYIDNVMVDPT